MLTVALPHGLPAAFDPSHGILTLYQHTQQKVYFTRPSGTLKSGIMIL